MRVNHLLHLLHWIQTHPEQVDPIVKPAAEDFLQMQIQQTQRDIKKNRPARQSSLRSRLRNLLASIVPHINGAVKDGAEDVV